MSKEFRKVAQMLIGISSEYLSGTIEEDLFKVQIEFANDSINKAENLAISPVSDKRELLLAMFDLAQTMPDSLPKKDKMKVVDKFIANHSR